MPLGQVCTQPLDTTGKLENHDLGFPDVTGLEAIPDFRLADNLTEVLRDRVAETIRIGGPDEVRWGCPAG